VNGIVAVEYLLFGRDLQSVIFIALDRWILLKIISVSSTRSTGSLWRSDSYKDTVASISSKGIRVDSDIRTRAHR
jgi:hypothetical protein